MTLYSRLFHHSKRIKAKLHLYLETTAIFDISSHVSARMRTEAPGAQVRDCACKLMPLVAGVQVRVRTKSLVLRTNTPAPALSD